MQFALQVGPEGPIEQSEVAPAHATPHPPQLSESRKSASQPSSAREEQWPNPATQAAAGTRHVPARQATLVTSARTLGNVVQSWPHAPQFFGSVGEPQAPPSPEVIEESTNGPTLDESFLRDASLPASAGPDGSGDAS